MTDRPADREKHCGGKKRQSEGTCTRPAGWGTDHVGYGRCKLHGGSTRSHSRGAGVAKARTAAATYGLPVDIDPAEALLDEVRRTYGHVVWLLDAIRDLEPDALVWGLTEEQHQEATEFPGVNRTYAATPNALLQAYREERDHLRRVAADTLRAGVEERRVRLAEQHGQLFMEAQKRILARFGIEITPEVAAAVGEELRSIKVAEIPTPASA